MKTLVLVLLLYQAHAIPFHKIQLHESNEMVIDTFFDDTSFYDQYSDEDYLLMQAEQLFQEENPIIEQMLQMAQGFGDGG